MLFVCYLYAACAVGSLPVLLGSLPVLSVRCLCCWFAACAIRMLLGRCVCCRFAVRCCSCSKWAILRCNCRDDMFLAVQMLMKC